MSGHSKWATIKRHKAAIDAKRGKIFSVISKELTIAARDGGGDPLFNPRLRMVMQKAKASNMPADNVDRAIKKGTGELPGVVYEELVYEGYGPGGVGIMVEVTTDNKNRSASEVRSTFTKCGGNLAGPGALAFNFQRKGQFIIDSEKTDEETLMDVAIEAGAEDILNEGDHFEVVCEITEFDSVSSALNEKNIEPDSSELAYIPNTLVTVTDPDVVKQVLRLTETLDDLEDVKAVWSNYDIDDALMQA
ncbi:YebC/PmpR family DNA-binding transcriptional regulator [Cerasicoccus arenae]|uniref:Probable transcriptional regulatory protein GCM10007047_12800 n=1 Tax=Cerasicoccus arenae TaxID=424488 RepID=A0A8J3DAU1_9BACT|nr:YebC/PmpR family DNA-binding transcriptional regulator [Cerasicoccus arenae]MBK1859163.1 YebC/PmpR family DNA-binding transcriptional regulator [Cerasicoccus arenae]GHB98216.1 putative transcriptional regulatory protein [Cerasicoccus arenae]